MTVGDIQYDEWNEPFFKVYFDDYEEVLRMKSYVCESDEEDPMTLIFCNYLHEECDGTWSCVIDDFDYIVNELFRLCIFYALGPIVEKE